MNLDRRVPWFVVEVFRINRKGEEQWQIDSVYRIESAAKRRASELEWHTPAQIRIRETGQITVGGDWEASDLSGWENHP